MNKNAGFEMSENTFSGSFFSLRLAGSIKILSFPRSIPRVVSSSSKSNSRKNNLISVQIVAKFHDSGLISYR